MAEQPVKPNVVEMAKRQRHIYLYEKLQKKKPLSPAELKELSKYEDKEKAPGILETWEQIAKVFGVSVRTVGYWARDGMPVRSDGKYDIKDIQSWKFHRKSKNPSGGPKNEEHWKTERAKTQARLAQIELQEREGDLIARQDVEKGLVAHIVAVKQSMLSLPRATARELENQPARISRSDFKT